MDKNSDPVPNLEPAADRSSTALTSRFRHRLVSIRSSLFWSVAILILLIAAALLGVSWLTARRAVQTLSQSLISRTKDLTERQLFQFFQPARGISQMTADWLQTGQVDLENLEQVNELFLPLLGRFPQINSMVVSKENRRGFSISRENNLWVTRVFRRDEWGKQIHFFERDLDGALLRDWWEENDFDVTTRPWYTGALQLTNRWDASGPLRGARREVHWTEPYIFYLSRKPGITISLPVRPPGSDYLAIVALDVLLEDISSFTRSLVPSKNGFTFVMTDGGDVLGLPKGMNWPVPGSHQEARALPRVEDLEQLPMAIQGVDIWRQKNASNIRPFPFQSGQERWWAGFREFMLDDQSRLWIGVMIPRQDILGDLQTQRNLSLLVLAGALILGVVMVFRLSRHFSSPLQKLVAQSNDIQQLNLQSQVAVVTRLKEIYLLGEAQERMRSTLESFGRYVPTDVVRQLIGQGQEARIGGQTKTLTVMFSDIRGFTAIAESMPPEELMHYLETYFNGLKEVLDRYGGTIDKFIGDAVLAFWGAPAPNPNHARDAVLATWDCVRRLQDFNRNAETRNVPPLRTGFGLASGPVVVGNMGASSRLNYSVMGYAVNLASRLEGLNKHYGTDILVSRSIMESAGDALTWRYLDNVTVKGGSQTEAIYEPLGRPHDVPEARLAMKKHYETALAHYFNRRFAEALTELRQGDDQFGQDVAWQLLRRRCQEFADQPPPRNWDTSFKFREK